MRDFGRFQRRMTRRAGRYPAGRHRQRRCAVWRGRNRAGFRHGYRRIRHVQLIEHYAWPVWPSLTPKAARSLLSQFSQNVAMLSHDALGGFHLCAKVLIVWCELNSFGGFEEVEAVALFDVKAV